MNKIILKILIIYLFAFYASFLYRKFYQYEYLTNEHFTNEHQTIEHITNEKSDIENKIEKNIKINREIKNQTTLSNENNQTDNNQTDNNQTDNNQTDNNQTDNNLTNNNETNNKKDNNEIDNNQTINNVKVNNQTDDYNNSKFQMYGPTNYLDPKDMTNEERLSYKNTYPSNMTLQDYVNWLLLYKNEQQYLSIEHVKNLKKILRGEILIYSAGILPPPTKISPPLTSSDYFDNLYINKNVISNPQIGFIHNEQMMAANSDNYGDFKENYNVYGTSGRSDLNPDLPDKKDLKNFIYFNNEEKNRSQLKVCD